MLLLRSLLPGMSRDMGSIPGRVAAGTPLHEYTTSAGLTFVEAVLDSPVSYKLEQARVCDTRGMRFFLQAARIITPAVTRG